MEEVIYNFIKNIENKKHENNRTNRRNELGVIKIVL